MKHYLKSNLRLEGHGPSWPRERIALDNADT